VAGEGHNPASTLLLLSIPAAPLSSGLRPLDRLLCVPTFQWVCLFQN
jgi:hypothetical protein